MRIRLERIYRQHRQGLFTLALSITGRPDQAEDAVHDAMARLIRAGHQPSGDPVAYVFAAVRNSAIDQKRQARPSTVSIFTEPAQEHDPHALAVNAERDQLIRHAIEALQAAEKQTVILRIYAGLTFEQIAQTLGEPLGTVTSRYRRTLDKLRSEIESFV